MTVVDKTTAAVQLQWGGGTLGMGSGSNSPTLTPGCLPSSTAFSSVQYTSVYSGSLSVTCSYVHFAPLSSASETLQALAAAMAAHVVGQGGMHKRREG